jgi:hypothetical protein
VDLDKGGVGWRTHPEHAMVELTPTPDLRQRLEVLPQSYLKERRVTESLVMATSLYRGKQALDDARGGDSNSLWPRAHYLSPLHPVLEWAADRVLESLGRNEVLSLVVPDPDAETAVLLHGTLTNARGQVVASSFLAVTFPGGDAEFPLAQPFATMREALQSMGATGDLVNTGQPIDVESLQAYVAPAVRAARTTLDSLVQVHAQAVTARIEAWNQRVLRWDEEAEALVQRADLRQRRMQVDEERAIAESMRPDQRSVRPLLLVVPRGEGSDACRRPGRLCHE